MLLRRARLLHPLLRLMALAVLMMGVLVAPIACALGERFDIKAFHDMVLRQGSVTLPVLEQQVRAFIAQSKARPADQKPAPTTAP